MQILLNKQCKLRNGLCLKFSLIIILCISVKADKKAEIEKVERQIQLQQEREDEMRELALKLRRR